MKKDKEAPHEPAETIKDVNANEAEPLTAEEETELKDALVGLVKKASKDSYKVPGEAFLVLPEIVDMLRNWEPENMDANPPEQQTPAAANKNTSGKKR